MIGVGLALLFLVSDLAFGNLAAWAAPARGVIVALMVVAWLVWIRSNHIVHMGEAGLVGVIAAMLISNAANSLNNIGLSSWLVYLGIYAAQRISPRDWKNDFATAGAIISVFTICNLAAGLGTGLWNRNTIAMSIMIMAPAMISRWERAGWLLCIPALMLDSRGAWVSMAVMVFVMIWPRLPTPSRMMIVFSIPMLFMSLVALRPSTFWWRLRLIDAALVDWSASPLFGVGPGQLWITPDRIGDVYGFAHAHQLWVSVGAQVGLVGLVIITMFILSSRRSSYHHRWELAMLAVAGSLSLFEDIAMVWQVGIPASIALAGYIDHRRDREQFKNRSTIAE